MEVFNILKNEVKDLVTERFEKPTNIQKKAISKVAEGRNSLIIAPTGTGKTESCILPVMSEYLKQRKEEPEEGIKILYITPLKALNRDILERIETWSEELGIDTAVRHGDTSKSERSKQTKNPPELLVTTPETLNIILTARKLGEHLKTVDHVIVDEIHELCESKRGSQLTVALERLVNKAGEYQRIGLSATVGDPEKVADFMFNERNREIIQTTGEKPPELKVDKPEPVEEDKELGNELVLPPDAVARLRKLKELIDEYKSVLTFVNTRQMAEMLSSRFEAWEKAENIGVHHSSLSKDARLVSEGDFKEGELKGMISTSSLELGIDIGQIKLTAQYLSPRQVNRLIQRVGRSGHRSDKTTRGRIITVDAEDTLESGTVVKKTLEKELEEPKIFEKPFDVLGHQLVGIAMEEYKLPKEKAYETVKRSYPFRNLTYREFLDTLNQMSKERVIWIDEDKYGKKRNCYKYYYGNISMIPDERNYYVKDTSTGSNVGVLDEGFVAEDLIPGKKFITKGQPWKVLDINEDEVLVEPASDISSAIPAWSGEEIPVPREIAKEFARQISEDSDPKEMKLTENASKTAEEFTERQLNHFEPDPQKLTLETVKDHVVIHSYNGDVVNETLGKLLSTLISSYLGESIGMEKDAYRIILKFPGKPREDLVEKFLTETGSEEVETVLEKSLVRTSLFRYRFIHVARRFGLINKGADYQKISVRRLIKAVLDSPIYKEAMNEIKTDKLDIPTAEQIIENIENGEIEINTYKSEEPSPLAKNGFKKVMRTPELVSPAQPEKEIINLMKERILNEKVHLKCSYCDHEWYREIKEMPEKIKCSECGSPMATYIQGKEELEGSTNLISSNGKKAVIALTATGVGPETAKRVLKKRRRTEEEFYKDLLEAKKKYIRTKNYWKE